MPVPAPVSSTPSATDSIPSPPSFSDARMQPGLQDHHVKWADFVQQLGTTGKKAWGGANVAPVDISEVKSNIMRGPIMSEEQFRSYCTTYGVAQPTVMRAKKP